MLLFNDKSILSKKKKKPRNNITDFQMKSKQQLDLITSVHIQLSRVNN